MYIKLSITIFLYLFSTSLFTAKSQLIVNHINLNKKEDIVFVQLKYKYHRFKNETKVSIDFGQASEFTKNCDNNVYNSDGKIIVFETVIGALNHLENNGWSLFAIENKISGGGDSSISVNPKYLFRRKDQIMNGAVKSNQLPHPKR